MFVEKRVKPCQDRTSVQYVDRDYKNMLSSSRLFLLQL
jgi:hypothetical protein